jgi:hypothetical protein
MYCVDETVLLYTFRLNKTSPLESGKCTGGKQSIDGMILLLCTHVTRTDKMKCPAIMKLNTPQEANKQLSCDYTIIKHKCSFL